MEVNRIAHMPAKVNPAVSVMCIARGSQRLYQAAHVLVKVMIDKFGSQIRRPFERISVIPKPQTTNPKTRTPKPELQTLTLNPQPWIDLQIAVNVAHRPLKSEGFSLCFSLRGIELRRKLQGG